MTPAGTTGPVGMMGMTDLTIVVIETGGLVEMMVNRLRRRLNRFSTCGRVFGIEVNVPPASPLD